MPAVIPYRTGKDFDKWIAGLERHFAAVSAPDARCYTSNCFVHSAFSLSTPRLALHFVSSSHSSRHSVRRRHTTASLTDIFSPRRLLRWQSLCAPPYLPSMSDRQTTSTLGASASLIANSPICVCFANRRHPLFVLLPFHGGTDSLPAASPFCDCFANSRHPLFGVSWCLLGSITGHRAESWT